jgi:hypothetical protein
LPSQLGRAILFVGSHSPLLLVIALYAWEVHWIATLALVVLLVASAKLSFSYVREVEAKTSKWKETIKEVEERPTEAMNYVAAYLVPFVALPFASWKEYAAIAIFLFLLGWLYATSRMTHLNPLLRVMRYRLFRVRWESGGDTYLLTRDDREKGSVLEVVEFDDGVFLDVTTAGA